MAGGGVDFAFDFEAAAGAVGKAEVVVDELVFRFFAVGVDVNKPVVTGLGELFEPGGGGGVDKELLPCNQLRMGFVVGVEFAAQVIDVSSRQFVAMSSFEQRIIAEPPTNFD